MTLDSLSKHEHAYTVIRQRILNGTYQPGHRLVIGTVAGELGISAVPVREAIRRLEAEGRVVYRHNVGARVAPVDDRHDLRVGIDARRGDTAAVLMDGRRVVSTVKTSSTADIIGGIADALDALMRDGRVAPTTIAAVMIGTSHFADAFAERRIAPVACVRLGLPTTAALPPMVDWPDDARAALRGRWYLAHGGHEVDGRVLSRIDAIELRSIAADIGAHGVRAVALSAVFSPLTPVSEEQAAAILRPALPRADVTLSHQVGGLGLLERENATIINASLRDYARATVAGLREELGRLGLVAALYFTGNDGTLMTAESAEHYPVLTFSAEKANSIRGVVSLTDLRDGVVMDVGGTTTDVGVLVRGFPRETEGLAMVGGVRTSVRMPDVRTFAFGSESVMSDRVGAALCRAVDRARGGDIHLPVVMVGGGASLFRTLLSGYEVIVPEQHAVANAVGAATAPISGDVDRIVSLEGVSRQEIIAHAVSDAVARAIMSGAHARTVQIVSTDEAPLAYLPGNFIRVRVKAIGELAAGVAHER